jgi:hypothetical protein
MGDGSGTAGGVGGAGRQQRIMEGTNLIVEHWWERDHLMMMRQLGLIE